MLECNYLATQLKPKYALHTARFLHGINNYYALSTPSIHVMQFYVTATQAHQHWLLQESEAVYFHLWRRKPHSQYWKVSWM